MSKKTLPTLNSIAKDALALSKIIAENKIALQDSSIQRLEEISEYMEKIKTMLDHKIVMENASAGATSAGSFAAVVTGGGNKPIKRMDEYTNEPNLSYVDAKGRPIAGKKGNKAKKFAHKINEDTGMITPVTPGEETAIDNLRTVTKGKYTGAQVGSAINKAASGANLNTYDQKILSPIISNLDTILQDPNSANQLKSAASRATQVATAKTAAVNQQKQKQNQTNQQQNLQQTTGKVTTTSPTAGGTNIGTNSSMQNASQLQNTGPGNQTVTQNNPYAQSSTNNNQNQINTGSGEQTPQTGFNTNTSESKVIKNVSEWSLSKEYNQFKRNS